MNVSYIHTGALKVVPLLSVDPVKVLLVKVLDIQFQFLKIFFKQMINFVLILLLFSVTLGR